MTKTPRVSKHTKRAAFTTVLAMIVSVLAFASPASADPTNLIVRRGEIGWGQSVDSLAGKENSGTQDNWADYVEFTPDDAIHRSIILVTPEGSGDRAEVLLNYRGPDSDENLWRLQVRDFSTNTWVEVFRNSDVDEWVWSEVSVDLDDADRFVRNGSFRFAYTSSNANDVSQLDLLAVTLSGQDPDPEPQPEPDGGYALPPAGAGFDYQINGDYTPAAGVEVVSRDWSVSSADPGLYSICYVNAFQTQPDYGTGRPDETSQWPASVVTNLEDVNWEGEFLIDISTDASRATAAQHMEQILDTCADKGYDAVEFDNLDSFYRETTGGTPWWGIDDAAEYAKLLTDYTHSIGLAAAQKNTAELFWEDSPLGNGETLDQYIGFDFAVSENCGQWDECGDYEANYELVFDIEYTNAGFAAACNYQATTAGTTISIVKRDLNVEAAGESGHVYETC